MKINLWYILRVALVASVGGFLFGFDLVIISGALPFLTAEFELPEALQGLAVSSAILGCIVGPLGGLWFADRWGRKKTLMFAGVLFVISTIGCTFSLGIWDFSCYRFFGGLGIGLAMISSPIYIAELAPAHLRGVLVNVNQLSNVIGINIAAVSCYFFSFDGWGWRWMMMSQIVPAMFLIIGLLSIPESPRWLVMNGKLKLAEKILSKINGQEMATVEIQRITESMSEEKGNFKDLLSPGIKSALIVAILLMILQQINGVNMLLLYAPTIMASAGVTVGSHAILSSLPVYVFILISTLISFPLIKVLNRRTLLIWSVVFMGIGHIVMALNFQQGWPPMYTLIPMLIGTSAFTLGLAPLGWIIISEIFPNRIRAKATAVVCFFLYLSSFITAQFFPMLNQWFNDLYGNRAGVYWMFAIICLLGALFCWLKVPETKGVSLENISEFWRNRNSKNK
ncbi:sugar porter family MFS transporter (plasmid) [Pedobacter sp. BS3]|uniref:sugar porter family MFS transporter n=1 Tax=Pedobacter sp. BS3 TaxID=2567937 RepID=UPI0011F04CF2|nr:sugar porter family MFS transporter [Pedobacter sp. BS3]TZF86259.1 sugar porter family MFS transporter [Pedobacter sp. BS3]